MVDIHISRVVLVVSRDVTKFEFEFDNVELRTFSKDLKFNECLSALLLNANS